MTAEALPTPEVTDHGAGALSATVSTATPAVAEEGGELLAGKFKSQDDLVKAYSELEKKLGQSSQQPAEETPQETETETTETTEGNDEEANDTTPASDSPYGEAVTEVLSKAGLNPAEVAEQFSAEGELSEDTYSKLSEAGYPREMIDAYKRGIQAEDAETGAINEAQIAQVKDIAGGEAEFAKLTDWMSKNVNAEGLTGYNEAVSSGEFAQASKAVADMRAKYVAAVGIEGELMGGKPVSADQGYTSEAEMLADMKKPEYKNNAHFRDAVSAKIAASSVFVTR